MIEIIEKQSFAVIGKMGTGPAGEGAKWIASLWEEANRHFNEIGHLAKLDAEGSIAGIWGAMSDVDGKFERWKEEGKYLAGCEVVDDAIAPDGWTKWVIPGFKYVAAACTQETYHKIFRHMLEEYLPQNHYQIVGAVQEYYNPKSDNGELLLYFPIER